MDSTPDTAPVAGAELLRVTPQLMIPLAELVWRYSASGGPGGQHANTANTRATVVFDIAGSPSLTEEQRQRLTDRYGVELIVSVSDERSQLRNRNLALERLTMRLAEALRVLPRRTPTRPSRGQRERRLQTKAHNSARKAGRRGRYSTDD